MLVPAVRLREAIDVISLVPFRGGILPSEFIRITLSDGVLTLALSAEMFGETMIDGLELTGESWVFYAERKLLSAFVNACDDAQDTDEILLEHSATDSGGELRVKYKRRKAVLHGIGEVTGYGQHDATPTREITLTDEHRALLRLASKYAPLDPTMAELNCVALLKNRAFQSSNQVAVFSASDPTVPLTMPFPLMLPELLSNGQVTGIWVERKGTRVNFPCGYVFQLINEKCRTDFPSDIISKYVTDAEKLPKVLVFKPKDLLTVLERLQIYTNSSGASEVTVRGKGTAGKRVLLLTSEAAQGVFHENMTLIRPLEKDITCEWPLVHLLPFTEFISSEPRVSVKFDPIGPYNFHASVGGAILDLMIARKAVKP